MIFINQVLATSFICLNEYFCNKTDNTLNALENYLIKKAHNITNFPMFLPDKKYFNECIQMSLQRMENNEIKQYITPILYELGQDLNHINKNKNYFLQKEFKLSTDILKEIKEILQLKNICLIETNSLIIQTGRLWQTLHNIKKQIELLEEFLTKKLIREVPMDDIITTKNNFTIDMLILEEQLSNLEAVKFLLLKENITT